MPDMKVLMVSDAGSIHTKRWAAALKEAGTEVVLFSITPSEDGFYEERDVRTYVFDLFAYKRNAGGAFGRLAAHCKAVKALKKAISAERPDILHAHYATSYGLVAALAGFHPLVVSVWGSDVYEFPRQSWLNRLAVKYILKKADRVLSTSRAMAAETSRYCRKDIGVTPFGVDTAVFRPEPEVPGNVSGQGGADGREPEARCGTEERDLLRNMEDTVVFGTVKTLSGKYGIDLLLKAFALARMRLAERSSSGAGALPEGTDGRPGEAVAAKTPGIRLVIAGKGPDRDALERMAESFGIRDAVVFAGEVRHEDVPRVYAGMDVAVFLSREESFGVSAVEAMACGVPVIASDADGFREVLSGDAGIIVPRENPEAASEEMVRLAMDPALRERYGKAGREKVLKCYEWKRNVQTMTDEYSRLLKSSPANSPVLNNINSSN